jgi:hypothetical protein
MNCVCGHKHTNGDLCGYYRIIVFLDGHDVFVGACNCIHLVPPGIVGVWPSTPDHRITGWDYAR